MSKRLWILLCLVVAVLFIGTNTACSYPNPFNQMTNAVLDLPPPSNVNLFADNQDATIVCSNGTASDTGTVAAATGIYFGRPTIDLSGAEDLFTQKTPNTVAETGFVEVAPTAEIAANFEGSIDEMATGALIQETGADIYNVTGLRCYPNPFG